jgi:hypothetical protein
VRAAFDMSYLALPPEQRRVFRLLGLHPGDDFGVNSAAALVDAGPADADELLEGLLDEHLLWQTTPGRYRMHNLLRLYARDRAHHDEPAPDRDAAVYRLACYQQAARSTGPGLASR